MFSGVSLTASTARPVASAVFAVAVVSILALDPPQDAAVWLTTAFPLAAAIFAIWRQDIPASYRSMDRTRLRAYVSGNIAILAICGITAYVCAALLPLGPALAVAAGFSCAAILTAVRLWMIVDARRRFTVWRR